MENLSAAATTAFNPEQLAAAPATQQQSRSLVSYIVFGVLLVSMVAALLYYLLVYRYYQSTDNAYVKADLTWITPRVSGAVIELNVKENQYVDKNQLLMVLDNRDLQARYEQSQAIVATKQASFAIQDENEKAAQASIMQAQSSVKAAQAGIMQANASVNAARAESSRLQGEYVRYQSLLKDGVITRQQFETINAQYISAQAQYDNALASVKAAQAQHDNALATVNAAQAQTQSIKASQAQLQADLNSARASAAFSQVDVVSSQITAPVAGKIGNLGVQLGSRVSPQTRILAIVPQHSAYVEANFKETQIEKMHIGQKVSLKLDAYPQETFSGKIESFSPASGATFSMMPPDNATGNFNKVVQRVPVRIAIDPGPRNELIKPGLSVVVKVDIRD